MATVAVIGLGLMGSSFALALKEKGGHVVVGSDPDPHVVRKALDRGIVSSAAGDLSIAGVADVIVLAVPILAMKETLNGLHGRVAGKAVTDMASTKAQVMEWAKAADVTMVGGHPMCGKESSGIDAADAKLFEGAPWVLTADHRAVTKLVETVGAHPVFMNAETHDRLVAGVSHAAFLLSVAYVLAVSRRDDWPEAAKLASSGFRDMSRLAAGDPEMYAGIAATNGDELVKQLDGINEAIAKLKRHLQAGDPRLVELFEEARSVRERWAK